MKDMNITHFMGIDVGKIDLYVQLYGGARCRFDNTPKGIRELLKWAGKLVDLKDLYCCLEQTGCYSYGIALALHEAGVKAVYVVNPRQIKAFGQQRLRRHKTDKADAQLIAEFLSKDVEELRPWQPPSPEQQEICELYRHIEGLTRQVVQLKNRLESVHCKSVKTSLRKVIRSHEREIERLRNQIDEILKSSEQLNRAYILLLTIPGVARTTAHAILAEVPNIHEFESGRQLAAWAGLTPRHFQSGTSGKSTTPITKVGSPRIRRSLYLPAMSAMCHNPQLKVFARRLKEKGKTGKQIIIAVARKLLELAYAILKSGKPFDPNHTNPNLKTT